eukprot:1405402-Amphidinium_carterae.1
MRVCSTSIEASPSLYSQVLASLEWHGMLFSQAGARKSSFCSLSLSLWADSRGVTNQWFGGQLELGAPGSYMGHGGDTYGFLSEAALVHRQTDQITGTVSNTVFTGFAA